MLNLILPKRCHLCQKSTRNRLSLCDACQNSLPYLTETCIRCSLPLTLATNNSTMLCGECLQKPPVFDQCTSLFSYEESMVNLITSLKFNKDLVSANLLGELFKQHVETKNIPLPDIILPVPLHKKRLVQRGFNQAIEIARPIAKKFDVPLSKYDCERIINTPPQMQLPANKRKQNVRNAFKIIKPLNANHVVILDDVYTTGSTVNELSRTLKKSGIEHVSVWCCARTNIKR